MKLFYSFFLIILGSNLAVGQKLSDESKEITHYKGNIFSLQFHYAYQIPAADLADRFKNNFSLGVAFEDQLPNNWLAGVDFQYMFGNNVKEDVLKNLKNSSGDIYGNNQGIASIVLRERGLYGLIYFGKIIPLGNPRSGIKVKLGAGYFQHKIRLQDDGNSVNQIFDAYSKGYDRLTAGIAVSEFIGYQYIPSNKRVNFFIGFESVQGFTKGQRDYQFDIMKPYLDNRLDIQWGIRAGWILPFFTKVNGEDYYY